MAKSLSEYIDELHARDLIWPKAPPAVPVKASSLSKPIPGIQAVIWNVYGTLLRIVDGDLTFEPQQEIRLQIALDKTIHEFNMWNSMTRKPGKPWEYMIHKYRDIISTLKMQPAPRGDFIEVNSAHVWARLIGQLEQKDYSWDVDEYGDVDDYSEKISYFFHASMQGTGCYKNALGILKHVNKMGLTQGLLADAQPFTVFQLLRNLAETGRLPPVEQLFDLDLLTLSFQDGARKPSRSLFSNCVVRCQAAGVDADQILYVSSRLDDDLAIAKKHGMKTVLFAGDEASLSAKKADIMDPTIKPDRLITELRQLANIIA